MFLKGYHRFSGAIKHSNFSQGRLDPEKVAPEIDPCNLAQGLWDFRSNNHSCLRIKVGKEWKYSSFILKKLSYKKQFLHYNDYNDYNDHNDYNDYNDYNQYNQYNQYNHYNQYNQYNHDRDSDLDYDWERFSELVT